MTIDTRDVARWAEETKIEYEAKPYSEFNDGVRCGMELCLAFIQLYEKHLGEDMAKSQGE